MQQDQGDDFCQCFHNLVNIQSQLGICSSDPKEMGVKDQWLGGGQVLENADFDFKALPPTQSRLMLLYVG